jgi:predicted nucleic acid-binding Zn ribbon protein
MPHMPTYEYFCEANGETLEVSHRMSELLGTWGELCQRLGTAPGTTPARAPIRRLISQAAVLSGRGASAAAPAANCDAGAACCGGGCGWPA